MADKRHKDQTWNIGEIVNGASWNQVHAALAMDIRDELKQLNHLLACPNFTAIPHHLSRSAREISGLRRDLKKKGGKS